MSLFCFCEGLQSYHTNKHLAGIIVGLGIQKKENTLKSRIFSFSYDCV